MSIHDLFHLEQITFVRLSLKIVLITAQVAAGFLFIRQREPCAWAMLMGSLLQLISLVIYQHAINVPRIGGATEIGLTVTLVFQQHLDYVEILKVAGDILFYFGLLYGLYVTLLHRRAQTVRIAELEQIAATQHAELTTRHDALRLSKADPHR